MRRRLSRGLIARSARASLCVCFAPEKPSSPGRVLSLAFLAALAPLPLRRSEGGARGVHSEIWWRIRRRASLYLHPHLPDLVTALRDRKPALRLLPLGQRPRRFCVFPWGGWHGKRWALCTPSFTPIWGAGEVITRAAAKLSLDWSAERPVEPQRGKLDERFLRFQTAPPHRSLPFFPRPPHWGVEVMGKTFLGPPSSSLYQITTVMWQGRVSAVTERCRVWNRRLRAICLLTRRHLWRLRPCPPSRCAHRQRWWARVAAAGQAGSCLHTMAVLQAYQADLLKELDEGEGFSADDISELRRTADLSLRATKETARAIGRSMAALGSSGEASLVDPVWYQGSWQGLPFGRSAVAFWPLWWCCWHSCRQAPGVGKARRRRSGGFSLDAL